MEHPGRVVILNGTSSAGKTSIATGFRDARAEAGELWFLVGIDDVLAKLPVGWVDLGLDIGPGPFARDGLWFEEDGDGRRRLRIGHGCRRLLRAYYGMTATAAHAGLDVIVDECMVDTTVWDDWQAALVGLDVTWIAIDCAPAVAEERERRRGDRPLGMAAAQHDVVHRHPPYSLRIDTTDAAPEECVRQLADHVLLDPAPG